MDIKELSILGNEVGNHWYYASKSKALLSLIKPSCSKIMDIGAGSAFFSHQVLEKTEAKESTCVDIEYKEDRQSVWAGKTIKFRKEIGEIDVDTVLLMDVLEHVDDDKQLLESYIKKVPQGTNFIITVPAFKFLWSQHDVFLGHKRRYTRAELKNLAAQCGLKNIKAQYFFALVFPLALISRLVSNILPKKLNPTKSQLKQHSKLVNFALKKASELEVRFMKKNIFFGLSIFCVATKP